MWERRKWLQGVRKENAGTMISIGNQPSNQQDTGTPTVRVVCRQHRKGTSTPRSTNPRSHNRKCRPSQHRRPVKQSHCFLTAHINNRLRDVNVRLRYPRSSRFFEDRAQHAFAPVLNRCYSNHSCCLSG